MTPNETIALRGAERYVAALRQTAAKRLAAADAATSDEKRDGHRDIARCVTSIADTLDAVIAIAKRNATEETT